MFVGIVTGMDEKLSRLENALMYLALVCIIAITGIVCFGIVARTLGFRGIPDDVVIVRMLIVCVIAGSLGYATRTGAHISIDLFFNFLGPKTQHALGILAHVVGIVLVVPIVIWAAHRLSASYFTGRFFLGLLNLPHWPVWLVFMMGFVSMLLRLIVLLLRDITEKREAVVPQELERAPL